MQSFQLIESFWLQRRLFPGQFTGGFKENQMNEITLNETSSKGLECALDAIYTRKLLLLEENVCDVLSVASLLQLMEVVKHVKNSLSLIYPLITA